ncbi:MAG: DUF2202 domain-containing protein [Chloroflexi bacterium]|nr:DUF2202 domain-containing protein [Chloroflexota bacterium]MBP7043055.1 DUF2202 domain-containing protein [Chloroflexota bacterium]
MNKQITWVTAVVAIALLVLLSACATDTSSTVPLPAESGINTGDTAVAPAVQPDEAAVVVELEAVNEPLTTDTLAAETAVAPNTAPVGNLVENSTLTLTAVTNLTAVEIDGLLYMREEEKLAHDVYVALYEMWGLPVFSNIATSEQMHTESVLALLNQYNLADPASSLGVGEFANPALQALYNQLITQGSQSAIDAILVGGLIEETDILDLETHLAETAQAGIIQVYENLLSGSANHLSSFASQYTRQTGAAYEGQVLSAEELAALLQNAPGNGQGGQGQNRGQGQGGQGQGQGRGTGQS